MNSLNKVQLIGNVTADPEVKVVNEDRTVAKFSIATNRSWKNAAGEKQEEVDFHNVVIWWKLAEIVKQYVTKGKKLYVEGRLQNHSWTDENGVKKYRTEIIADSMIMLSGGDKKSNNEDGMIQEDPEDDHNIVSKAELEAKPKKKTAVRVGESTVDINDVPF